ncbi:MAG: hypothetical protein DWC08_05745 [Candidatus Poseidoniales archaeon]|nr:MAG: hypothetical protein DWC08_05745 [Candidatus Poseidoniales archaeon]
MSQMTFARIYEEKRSFVLSLAVLVILGILYVVFGQSNWAEGPVESATRFCEKISDGLIKEPVNAFSNFTYIIVGLVILWNMPSKQEAAANPMLEGGLYPTLFAVGSMYIGIGSFAMHGTNTNWGTSMDWTGMLFFISFPVYYNLSRQFQWSDKLFMSVFFTMFFLTAVLDTYASNNNHVLIENFSDSKKLRLNQITRDYMWSLYIGTWIIQEAKNLTQNRLVWMIALPLVACVTLSVGVPVMQILILCVMFVGIAMVLHFKPGQTLVRNPNPHLWYGVGCYVVGNIVWRFGRDGEAACNPDTLFQYHALWHVFTGLAVYFFYRYFITENNQKSH